MHATQQHGVFTAPHVNPAACCGARLRLPDTTGKRVTEGGLRLAGTYKASRAGLPLVSIITVCLNACSTLRQSMQSVFAQTYPNIEYLVVDGGSRDGTAALLAEHARGIDYYVSEPDKGLYQAMNKGLSLATGEYVLILNADDWYEPDCVAALVSAATCSNASVVSALARYVNPAANTNFVLRSMPFDESVRLRMPLRHETMLVPARLYNALGGYDESYKIIADFHFTIRAFEAGFTHYEVPRPLLHFRTSGVSNTNIRGLQAERLRLLRAQFPFLELADARLMMDLGAFAPAHLEALLRRYRHKEDFCRSLLRFQASEAINGSKAWRASPPPAVLGWGRRPRVSVILPVFKAQDFVGACIDSVLAQTMTDFELLCLNDASPDNSQQVIDAYCARDSRVVSLPNPRNLGLGATRNRGIRHARGDYVFHVDPDDTIPPTALQSLLACAEAHHSQLVRGAFLFSQTQHGASTQTSHKKTLCHQGKPVYNTTLKATPALLRTTEGHWSFLYRMDLARSVPYPENLTMGQDSIFLVNALLQATSISIIDDVVYHYQENSSSAMNTFGFRKYMDDLEWRRRAWHMLHQAGLREIGDRLLQDYWMDQSFINMARALSAEELHQYFQAFRAAFAEAGLARATLPTTAFRKQLFSLVLQQQDAAALALMQAGSPKKATPAAPVTARAAASCGALRVAMLYTSGTGGAGIAARRNAEALRTAGLLVQEHSPAPCGSAPHLSPVPLQGQAGASSRDVWTAMEQRVFAPFVAAPHFRAREYFSTTQAVVDFQALLAQVRQAQVLNLHWVSGMLEYAALGDALAQTPIVWTLHDMHPFTGGCHYAEDCEQYTSQCEACPLAGDAAPLAHAAWHIKRQALEKLQRLHVVCPSQWLADRAAKSSLLRGRPIHVIPNVFPVSRFMHISRHKARARLGLPATGALVLFGADNMRNRRKGGDLLAACMGHLPELCPNADVTALLLGNHAPSCDFKSIHLGFIADELQLILAYSAADALVFPSREDNAPLTVGEAMLCGTPVVGFPVGYVPEVLTHGTTGYLATQGDARSLAEGVAWALQAASRDPLLPIRCRQQFMAQQQQEGAARQYRKLFEAIAP